MNDKLMTTIDDDKVNDETQDPHQQCLSNGPFLAHFVTSPPPIFEHALIKFRLTYKMCHCATEIKDIFNKNRQCLGFTLYFRLLV